MNNNLEESYYIWMLNAVKAGDLNYDKVFRRLNGVPFYSLIPMDDNRVSDGIQLRYSFGYESGVHSAAVATILDCKPCSVLEMMVALALRCEREILHDEVYGDRSSAVFRYMLMSLGLDSYTDDDFDEAAVDGIINRFLERKYEPNGEGGLFYIPGFTKDLRNEEIWYQANYYFRTI